MSQGADKHDEAPPAPGIGRFLLVALVAIGLLGWGGYGRWRQQAEAAKTRDDARDFIPTLRVTQARLDDQPLELTLPGETQAFQLAAISARSTGYIAERRVDIGSRVKKGDLLLRVAAPDLDQQLEQAQAQLGQMQAALLQAKALVDQANANLNLANVTNSRTSTLATQGWATRQNADSSQAGVLTQTAGLASAEAGVKVGEANLKAQAATVDRLKALAGFKDIVAPFDGVVTTRSVEVGDLVRADAGGTPLITVAQDDVLRISVNVPQFASSGVAPGVAASIRAPQTGGRSFDGHVERISGALLNSSRTLTTEVDVPNPDEALRAGLYVYVTLKIPRSQPAIMAPADALVFNQGGTQVAVAGDDDRIEWRPVEIRRDLGDRVELGRGLEGHERLVLGPPADLKGGQAIKIAPPQPAPGDKPKDQPQAKPGDPARSGNAS
jgi:RND family efflux transporter MFP subunit